MANVYATKTGNWSDTTVWNTSALPTSADDVYSNNYTVTIDQDVAVKSLRNTSATSITAGGGFTCSTGRTIDCSGGTGFWIPTTGAGNLLTCTHTSGTTVTILGNCNQGSTSTNYSHIVLSGTGTTAYTGTLFETNGGYGSMKVSGAGTVTITGAVSGSAQALNISAAATVSVIGNVTQNSTGTYLIVMNAACNLSITGNVSTTTAIPAVAITNNFAATLTVTGTVTAASTSALFNNSASPTLIATGPFISGSTGFVPFNWTGPVKLTGIAANEFRFAKSTSGTTSLWSSDVNSGAPSAANVRSGTKFGVSNEFTGTLAVPPTNSVASGVPVDNTTGTAALAPSDVAALVGAQIAAALDSAP